MAIYYTDRPQLLNVKEFGAKGDGVVDDTAATLQAIRLAQTLQVPVYFPAGSYNLSSWSSETISSDLTIIGDGKELVTITGPDTSTDFMAIVAGNDIRIKDVGFSTWQYPVILSTSTSTSHESIEIRHCKADNVNIFVADNGSANQDTTNSYIITDCEISNCVYAGIMHRALNIRRAEVSRNKISAVSHTTNTAQGIQLGQNVESPMGTIIVSENDISDIKTTLASSSTYGIIVYGDQVTISNNHIRNTWTDDKTGSFGIYTKAHLSKVIGNTLRNAGGSDGAIIIKGLDSESSPGAPFGYGSMVTNNSLFFTNSDRNNIPIKTYTDRSMINGNIIEGKPATTFTANDTTDVITSTDHRLDTDDIVRFTTTGTLPSGLSTGTDYWVTVTDKDDFTVSASDGGATVDILDTGTGTHSIAASNITRGIVSVAKGTSIINNIFHRIYHTTTMSCIEINGATDALISGNVMDDINAAGGWAMGVYLKHASGGPWKNFQIVGNRFANLTGVSDDRAIHLNPNAGIEVSNVNISSNHFQDLATAVALNAGICKNGQVVDNTFENVTDEFKQGINKVDGWKWEVNNIVLDTSGNTETTFWDFQTNDDTAYHVSVDITAVNTDDYTEAANYQASATFKNNSGTVTQVGTTDTVYFNEDADWSVNIDFNSLTLRARVTGGSGTNVTWRGKVSVQTVA